MTYKYTNRHDAFGISHAVPTALAAITGAYAYIRIHTLGRMHIRIYTYGIECPTRIYTHAVYMGDLYAPPSLALSSPPYIRCACLRGVWSRFCTYVCIHKYSYVCDIGYIRLYSCIFVYIRRYLYVFDIRSYLYLFYFQVFDPHSLRSLAAHIHFRSERTHVRQRDKRVAHVAADRKTDVRQDKT